MAEMYTVKLHIDHHTSADSFSMLVYFHPINQIVPIKSG
ncbi:uncharacterized protein G2W53_042236 [Senna tora]|uniref:Uncharacterized protein n=1 Tax=Senna tora TaxID=362788 RepID=A0A834SF21_9FABA|nr:uncharacterized protein G2W53_042236 [Senna tora]